jgi:hypothetical protein
VIALGLLLLTAAFPSTLLSIEGSTTSDSGLITETEVSGNATSSMDTQPDLKHINCYIYVALITDKVQLSILCAGQET